MLDKQCPSAGLGLQLRPLVLHLDLVVYPPGLGVFVPPLKH